MRQKRSLFERVKKFVVIHVGVLLGAPLITICLLAAPYTVCYKMDIAWYVFPCFVTLVCVVVVTSARSLSLSIADCSFIVLLSCTLITNILHGRCYIADSQFIALVCVVLCYLLGRLEWKFPQYEKVMLAFSISGLFEMAICIWQMISTSLGKKVTGSFINADYLSQYLALSVVTMGFQLKLKRQSNVQIAGGILAVSVGIFIIAFNESRAALASLFLVALYQFYKRKSWRLIFVFGLAALPMMMMYQKIKPGSIAGRELIYKVISSEWHSISMWGSGCGSYSLTFPDWQASYFHGHINEKDRIYADDIPFPFNGLIKYYIEEGIIWAIAFIWLCTSAIYAAKKKEDVGIESAIAIAIVIQVLMQSCVSNIFEVNLPTVVMFISLGYLSSKSKVKLAIGGRNVPQMAWLILRFIPSYTLALTFCVMCEIYSKNYWKWATGERRLPIKQYKILNGALAKNPIFTYEFARACFDHSEYEQSLYILRQGLKYSASYDWKVLIGLDEFALNRFQETKATFGDLSYYIPHRLYPNYMLMVTSCKMGDSASAVNFADRLIELTPKVSSEFTNQMKAEAKRFRLVGVDVFH